VGISNHTQECSMGLLFEDPFVKVGAAGLLRCRTGGVVLFMRMRVSDFKAGNPIDRCNRRRLLLNRCEGNDRFQNARVRKRDQQP